MHHSGFQHAAFAAVQLHQTRPEAPALEVLDLALKGLAPAELDDDIVHPASPFGQVIAAAFDTQMTPEEWAAWAGEGSERSISDALLRCWHEEVLPKFWSRYGATRN